MNQQTNLPAGMPSLVLTSPWVLVCTNLYVFQNSLWCFYEFFLMHDRGDFAGNPARSPAVKEWLKGYHRMMASLGYSPQSAHPWTTEDLTTVLQHIDQKITDSKGIPLLKLLRDAFAMTILWDTCSRGCTALTWQIRDVLRPDGKPPITVLPES